ncbi:hypothetical protein NPIL_680281 [Nephila pilipes]|uniref:Uncharacterized protein n=1 Tax=Nephila pilipes TaxID=299642 RepID=A0A8X6R558_NEPPI|nr:hypothetical protein NPIL_680281 [Nephila pilipes]
MIIRFLQRIETVNEGGSSTTQQLPLRGREYATFLAEYQSHTASKNGIIYNLGERQSLALSDGLLDGCVMAIEDDGQSYEWDGLLN